MLCLDWARCAPGEVLGTKSDMTKRQPAPLLASSGRDGFVHIFGKGGSSEGGGGFLQPLITLDDHGGTPVAAIRFADAGCSLVSCGGDRSVALRRIRCHDSGDMAGTLVRRLALSATDCSADVRQLRAALAAREGGMAVINTTSGAEMSRRESLSL